MRRRKLFIGALLAFAIAFLGIGYAAITNRTLTVSGTAAATADDSAFDVKFTGTPTASTTNGGSSASASGTVTGDLAATITVSGMTTKDQYVTVTYTISNASTEYDAQLDTTYGTSGILITNADDGAAYFTVTATLGNEGANIAAGGSTTLVVKVQMAKTPAADVAASDISVSVRYKPVEKSA